jgi:predicted metalloprotease
VRPARVRFFAPLVVAALLLGGCSSDDSQSPTAERAKAVVEAIREAVEQAKADNEQRSGDVQRGTQAADVPLRADTQTAFDYKQYQTTISSVLTSLDAYWAEQLPASFDVPYEAPQRFVYYRSDEAAGPRCGDEAAPAKNAFYCPAGDFIAWDESGLIIPFYVSVGDFAAGFVLAHEFGHAMQVRLPRQERLGILRELQADCFAGAWARDVQNKGMLEAGDLDEATLGVISARDLPGTPWTDPRAHGSGFERTRAFTDGYEKGPTGCYPAPAEAWIVG